MELKIDDSYLAEAVKRVAESLGLVPESDVIGKQIGLEEFRKKYCRNKSPLWVQAFIFDRYPETWQANGGFVSDPHPGTGKAIWINEYEASRWIQSHYKAIDWNARLERG